MVFFANADKDKLQETGRPSEVRVKKRKQN